MQKGQGLGVPPDKDVFFGMDAATLTAITLAGVIGLVGIILWRYLSPPPSSSSGRKQTPTRLPQSNSRDTIKAHKPDPWTPDTEAEDLLATASEDEQKKLRPLITSLAPTSDHNAQIKAARAALFYVQDEAQWDLMRRAGVLSAMARLVVATASRAAERGEGPPREAAAVLAALAPALARLARAPELREALATPALVQHVIYLLHSPTLVEPTKAALVALLNLFVRLGPNTPPMRAAMADYRLGPTLAQLFLEATTESGEALIKHTANAVVPFIGAEDESATAEALLQHGGVEHALQLFETGRTAFAKRRTPLALVSLLGALSRVANAETCEQVLSRSLAEYMIAELRKNQKPAFRQHLPELLGLLRALLLQPDERPGPPRAHLDAARRRFQDFFLDEREDDGTTGLEQIMSFLRDPKVFADAAEVLLDLSLANERIVAGIKANEEAMKHIRAAAEDEAHPGNEPASLLLARLGSTAAAQ